jgi:hypothetical protein
VKFNVQCGQVELLAQIGANHVNGGLVQLIERLSVEWLAAFEMSTDFGHGRPIGQPAAKVFPFGKQVEIVDQRDKFHSLISQWLNGINELRLLYYQNWRN